ncbi:hypothetical protein B566_EDAN003037 [Ephemera danica]|nr:hypothetical protein B566_EDAN003037 [Ephemera danica]
MGTTQEEIELDQMAQAELSRLQRQYRIMEEDRQAYAEEVRTVLARQRRQISSLEQEKKQLAMSPEMAHLSAARRHATRSGRRLVRKLDKQDEVETCIRTERDQISDVQIQVARLEREVENLRRGGEGDMSRREALKSAQRAERLLGDRLHHASVRFNSLLAENKHLRAELDHLLNERGLFNALYTRLNERLAQGRKQAAELTDQATQAYDQREEAQARLQTLREQARIDAERHSADMSVLQRQLDSVSKLYNFLGTKGQRRTTAHLEAQEALKQSTGY